MPWAVAAAGVSAAGGIAGSLIGASASETAAKDQEAAQQRSLNWIQSVYGNTQSNLSPFVNTGQQALSTLAGFYGLPGGNAGGAQAGYQSFMGTPFYQFPLQQANLATNRSLAAMGLNNSGGALRDVSQLNAGYASQGLAGYLSGISGLANAGQSAGAQLGSIGVGTGAQVVGANTAFGNAGAAGAIGSANATASGIGSAGGAIGSLINNANFQNYLNGSSSAYSPPTTTVSNPNVSGGSYQAATSPSDQF